MSRRSKLLITALFLVLLGIPIGYVLYGWNVPEPLRFRVVAHEVEPEVPVPETTHHLRIEVQNTSSVPVYLASGVLFHDKTAAAMYRPWMQLTSLDSEDGLLPEFDGIREPVYIPAHGTWRGRARGRRPNADVVDLSQLTMRYQYASPPRLEILHRYWSACLYLSDSIKQRFDVEFYQRATAPVELSAAQGSVNNAKAP
ncbi:hypothetical protein DES53_11581 [Roseimicrobium gellanilyticum]|uniref:Uncharacterized protein n=1 Tax=Roseimicrobium gellanilyticum TaxID=748857 RepID=A0A366H7H8_9BACT|nr:hypothetical protein [Roseimicrobium gellanilyticum]RBP36940.1 hypothetical protein DES53_11581 [Roseimicrobium gellanilyticum]